MSAFGKVILFTLRRRVSQVFVSKLLLEKKIIKLYRVKKNTSSSS